MSNSNRNTKLPPPPPPPPPPPSSSRSPRNPVSSSSSSVSVPVGAAPFPPPPPRPPSTPSFSAATAPPLPTITANLLPPPPPRISASSTTTTTSATAVTGGSSSSSSRFALPPPPPSANNNGAIPRSTGTNLILSSPLPPPPPPASASTLGTTTTGTRTKVGGTMTTTRTADEDIAATSFVPHAVRAAMPSLLSAPTSANITIEELTAKMTSASTELLQGAADFFTTGGTTTTTTAAMSSQQQQQSQSQSQQHQYSFFSTPNPNTNPAPSSPLLSQQHQSSSSSPLGMGLTPPTITGYYNSPTVVSGIPPPPPRSPTSRSSPNNAKNTMTLSPSRIPSNPVITTVTPSSDSNSNKPANFVPYTHYNRLINGSTKGSSSSTLVTQDVPPISAHQASIPILLIATESANEIAYKNGLHLSDLFEGLVQKNWMNNTNAAAAANTGNATYYLPPFRSVSRSYTSLTWDDLAVLTFTEPDKITRNISLNDNVAASILQNAVAVQDTDGNIQQDLNVLEDQIDHLLYTNDTTDDDNNEETRRNEEDPDDTVDDVMSHYQRMIRKQEQAYKDAYQLTSPLTLPWLYRYRLALDETTSGSGQQYDQFNCPVIIITVCSTAEELNPIETLDMLTNQPFYLPSIYYKNGLYDPNNVRREVLVLHDNCSGPRNWDESALRGNLQRKYGTCATVLRVNSIPAETAYQLSLEETNDLWGGKGKLGNCLSVADRATIRKYIIHLIQNAVIPALERRISDLNLIVNDRKKGVKNVLKSLWGGGRQPTTRKDTPNHDDHDDPAFATTSTTTASTTTAATSPYETILYKYDAIESQTRLLGDTLFIMKDYEGALSMYRLIKEDYKQDHAWTHYGSIQEMIALCLYYIDPYRNSKEIFATIESALLSYNRAATEEMKQITAASGGGGGDRAQFASLSTRLATRLCLVLASPGLRANIVNGRYMEVADLLASASSGETSLGAAVLLEQSAAHYYQAEMYRKYAFHMLMSGHMFRSATNADHHAFRCFTSALHIYNLGGSNRTWEELQNHLRSALASLLFSMGRMSIALQLYAKLLGTTDGGRVSVKSQQKFITNLLEICNDHKKKALAGVDRMIASSISSSESQRDRVRKEHLDRIVQVIQYTKTASRILEIPNIDLPYVDDTTVTVIAEEEQHHLRTTAAMTTTTRPPQLGEPKVGSTEVWDDLMLWTIAELKAATTAATNPSSILGSSDEIAPTIKKALQKVDDVDLRRVLTLIEKEKAARVIAERTRRRGKGGLMDNVPVRAQQEPIEVQFTLSNPLGLSVDVNDLQLVAKMTDGSGGICTNEGAVYIKPLVSYSEPKTWTFQNSPVQYSIADFCRISASKNKSSSDPSKVSWKSAEEIDPYFVVTKTNYSLAPESTLRVSASICPLLQGQLEIVGIRGRLFDSVWIYHPFRIKGPLLQNTRSNRAHRIRGESVLLKSKVERGMPCLSVDLLPRNGDTAIASNPSSDTATTVLQGQIGKWTLRVSNIGTAQASRITMKTNLPWVTIEKTATKSSSSENDTTSYCIGPSGTLMTFPINDFGTLQHANQIHPGESVDIPVEIRTSGVSVGKQDLYLLFRYELPDADDSDSSATTKAFSASASGPRFRWFKKMFEIPVYPSLSVSAAIIPAFPASSRNEHVVTIESTNDRFDRPDKPEILLQSVALASRHYKLEPLPGQFPKSSTAGRSSTAVKLGWQERATVHYRIVPKDETPSTKLPLLSGCPLITDNDNTEKSNDTISPSLLNFLCLERAHTACEEAITTYQMALSRAAAQADDGGKHPRSIAEIRRANAPGDSSNSKGGTSDPQSESSVPHPTSIERLCPDDGNDTQLLHILCSWSDIDQTMVGEHHIRNMPILRPYANGTKDGCPITITATHPITVSNDFNNGPAIVPVEVVLRNRLAAGNPSNTVEIEFAIDPPDNFDFISYPQEGYRRKLKGGEELTIPLRALLPFQGIYNLQKLRLTTIVDNNGIDDPQQQQQPQPHVQYHFPQQWMVAVRAL